MFTNQLPPSRLALLCALAVLLPSTAWGLTLDYTGVTQAGGPHDAYLGEMDVSDSYILAGSFGSSGSNVRTGFTGECSGIFCSVPTREATNAEYSNLAASNDYYFQTGDPGYGDNAWLRFEFDTGLTGTDILLVDEVFVHMEARQGDPNTDDWYLYAWDYNQGRYLRLSFFGTKPPDETREATLIDGFMSENGLTLSDVGDLIDPSTGQLTILTVNQDTSDWLRVDTVNVDITLVPEPGTASLMLLGLVGLAARRRC
jgi:hypothetical protein